MPRSSGASISSAVTVLLRPCASASWREPACREATACEVNIGQYSCENLRILFFIIPLIPCVVRLSNHAMETRQFGASACHLVSSAHIRGKRSQGRGSSRCEGHSATPSLEDTLTETLTDCSVPAAMGLAQPLRSEGLSNLVLWSLLAD